MPRKKVNIKYEKIDKSLPDLDVAYEHDAGTDLIANKKMILSSASTKAIPTGIKFDIPQGYYIELREKSGFSTTYPLSLKAGIIDSGYTGEVQAVFFNYGNEPITIEKGTKIVQFIVRRLENTDIELVDKIDKQTERGEKGFASSGTTA